MTTLITSDFMILGPAMASGSRVLDAIHALYFLPENFKLILAGSDNVDQSFLNEMQARVAHVGVSHRVWFDQDVDSAHVVILPNIGMTRSPKTVSGDSPEALASAILSIARAG